MRAATLEKGMLITVADEITAGGPEARDTGANRFNTDSVTTRGQSHHFGGRLTPFGSLSDGYGAHFFAVW